MSVITTGRIIRDWTELFQQRNEWRQRNLKVVFTNGIFDILHRGHLDYLLAARSNGDLLVVGVNTDDSTMHLKGAGRPIIKQEDRAFALSCLRQVDVVTFFNQDTPLDLILGLRPDVLVKGADYAEREIVGAREVKETGGQVVRIPLTKGNSTTLIIDAILKKSRLSSR